MQGSSYKCVPCHTRCMELMLNTGSIPSDLYQHGTGTSTETGIVHVAPVTFDRHANCKATKKLKGFSNI